MEKKSSYALGQNQGELEKNRSLVKDKNLDPGSHMELENYPALSQAPNMSVTDTYMRFNGCQPRSNRS